MSEDSVNPNASIIASTGEKGKYADVNPKDIGLEFIEELIRDIAPDERLMYVHKSDAERDGWPADPWNDNRDLYANENLYVTVASFKRESKEVSYRRKVNNFGHGLAVFLDDIGSGKGSKGKFTLKNLPLPPTVTVETSSGNYQVWYLLDQPAERDEFANFNYSLRKHIPGLGDDTAKDLNRVGRVPFGINNKKKHLSPSGEPFKVNLYDADYDRRYSLEEIAQAFGFQIEPEPRREPIERLNTSRTADDIYNAWCYSKALDICVPTRGRGEKDGRLNIACPWTDEHSGGRADGAVVWGPDAGMNNPYGFKCHHHNCTDRHWLQFKRIIEAEFPVESAQARMRAEATEWDYFMEVFEKAVAEWEAAGEEAERWLREAGEKSRTPPEAEGEENATESDAAAKTERDPGPDPDPKAQEDTSESEEDTDPKGERTSKAQGDADPKARENANFSRNDEKTTTASKSLPILRLDSKGLPKYRTLEESVIVKFGKEDGKDKEWTLTPGTYKAHKAND